MHLLPLTYLRLCCYSSFHRYNAAKKAVTDWQKTENLHHWQSLVLGGLSGGVGPLGTTLIAFLYAAWRDSVALINFSLACLLHCVSGL